MCKSELYRQILGTVSQETEISEERILSKAKNAEIVDAKREMRDGYGERHTGGYMPDGYGDRGGEYGSDGYGERRGVRGTGPYSRFRR